MKKLLALVLFSSVAHAAPIKETQDGQTISMWVKISSTLTKVFEAETDGDVSVPVGALRVASITDVAGTGAPALTYGLTTTSTVAAAQLSADTITNKAGTGAPTLSQGVVVAKALITTPVSLPPVGAAVTFPATGTVFYSTISASITTVNLAAIADGQSVTWVAIASGGPWTITGWTNTPRWRFGTAYPNLPAGSHNIYTIMHVGSFYYIAVADQMIP